MDSSADKDEATVDLEDTDNNVNEGKLPLYLSIAALIAGILSLSLSLRRRG